MELRHAPHGYDCPFCALGRGTANRYTSQDDLVYRESDVIAFASLHWFPSTPGHILVVPTAHIEHVYALPDALGTPLQRAIGNVARAMKAAYRCTGVTIAQNNEPDGGQDVWHYHVHVFPRFPGDRWRREPFTQTTAAQRAPYVMALRNEIGWLPTHADHPWANPTSAPRAVASGPGSPPSHPSGSAPGQSASLPPQDRPTGS